MHNLGSPHIRRTLKKWTRFAFLPIAGLIYFLTQENSKKDHEISLESKKAGHELSEANAKGLMWFGISMFLGAILMHIILAAFFFDLRRQDQKHSPLTSAKEIFPDLLSQRKPPNQPRLQIDPQTDLQNYFKEQKRLLSSYEWIDQKAQKVRIPINRAIEILSGKSEE